jgi:hypothetical protein
LKIAAYYMTKLTAAALLLLLPLPLPLSCAGV